MKKLPNIGFAFPYGMSPERLYRKFMEATMIYVVQGTRRDTTIAELFRSDNLLEASRKFDALPKHSYVRVTLVQELQQK